MSPPRTRVLAIGLDALGPPLVEAWMADGTLPNLRALRQRGVHGPVRGVEGFYVGSTWPSLYTGTNPASHGVHYELQVVPGTYDLHRVQEGAFVRRETLWDALSRQGRRVAALDVPLGRPSEAINGVQVVDWGGHDVFFGFQASPSEWARVLADRYGMHPHGVSCDVRRHGVDDYRELVDRQAAGVATKVRWTRELLNRGDWDLFLQVFTEGHCVGHQCWHLHDASHPNHDPGMAAELGDPLRSTYRALDRAVGELVDAAGDATVLVFAGHGMSYWRGAHFLLPDILARLGVCEPPSPAGGPRRPLLRAARAVWSRMPEPLRTPIRRIRTALRSHDGERNRDPADRLDRPVPPLPARAAGSLCFPVHNGTAASGIRLNLVGREPAGRLRPGAEADAFCDDLAASLTEIVDERTGAPVVHRVIRTRDLYSGAHLDLLPDLLVEWSDDVPTGSAIVGDGSGASVRVRSPRIGTVEAVNRFGRTGGHRRTGWFIAAGADIVPGRLDRGISVLDVAPTVASLLDAELPEADGRPVPELTGRRVE